jgi:DMSO/TMAO reductase YedYZ heme-binding membrane subunit
MRMIVALIVALGVAWGVFNGIGFLGAKAGVFIGLHLPHPMTVSSGMGPAGEDRVVESVMTRYGMVAFALSILLAIWSAKAIYRKSWRARWTDEDLASVQASVVGLLVLTYAFAITDLAFRTFDDGSFSYTYFFTDVGAALLVLNLVLTFRKVRLGVLKAEARA